MTGRLNVEPDAHGEDTQQAARCPFQHKRKDDLDSFGVKLTPYRRISPNGVGSCMSAELPFTVSAP
jgi:hypothetical protein